MRNPKVRETTTTIDSDEALLFVYAAFASFRKNDVPPDQALGMLAYTVVAILKARVCPGHQPSFDNNVDEFAALCKRLYDSLEVQEGADESDEEVTFQ